MQLVEWNEQRHAIFLDRYALRDEDGDALEESPGQMWMRVANRFGRSPEEVDQFMSALWDFKMVPSGRILVGTDDSRHAVNHYNCYVAAIESKNGHGADSRQAIMETLTRMVEITARGGGVGINWSTLRPEGSYIRGVHGMSSGSVNWMYGADGLADQIRQGGSRTAALMFLLEDWHPDLMQFISSGRSFKRANYSVAISDRFMRALENGEDWTFVFPDTKFEMYDEEWDGDIERWIAKGFPVTEHGTMSAEAVWDHICMSAWASGNPGVIFLERMNKMSNTRYLERIVGVNPCGEQPLPAWGVCNLGAVNLVAMFDEDTRELDYESLREAVHAGVRLLDAAIDRAEPVDESVSKVQARTRRVGLGLMGLADYLILKGLRYGSPEAVEETGEIYRTLLQYAYEASVDLAIEYGPAQGFDLEWLDGENAKKLPESLRDRIRRHGIRNLTVLSQAPTGTTSILAGVSSGIEPIFSSNYTRVDATGSHVVTHPLFDTCRGPEHVVASDLSVEEHIDMQAAAQVYVDTAISKTVNLPGYSGVKEVDRTFRKAYHKGCKGITIYRDGSLDNVLSDLASGQEPVGRLDCPSCEI